MGKKRKIRTGAGDVVPMPGPLHKQIEKDKIAKSSFKVCIDQQNDDKHDKFVDAVLSTKILQEAQKQWREEEKGNGTGREESDLEGEPEVGEDFSREAQELSEQIEINSDEEAQIGGFTANGGFGGGEVRHDLAHENKKQRGILSFICDFLIKVVHQIEGISPAVVTFFTEIGHVMEKYRSAAMFQATRVFSATGTPSQCQRFNTLVLLPRLRDEIDEYKKLNFHLYQCLFKAILARALSVKPSSLVSIPQLHAAAAMLSIAKMDYSGAISYILRVLVEKNYTLPFRALDGLVFHFLEMRSHQGELPVIWHQTLLAFVERYANDISAEQREALIELTKVHSHHQITSDLLRLLRAAESRNEESEANVPVYARNDEMEF
uniref:EOG090X058P n=1 Tax=Globodera pallida TaxID=36090 RepID=A0A183BP83_GLOPA